MCLANRLFCYQTVLEIHKYKMQEFPYFRASSGERYWIRPRRSTQSKFNRFELSAQPCSVHCRPALKREDTQRRCYSRQSTEYTIIHHPQRMICNNDCLYGQQKFALQPALSESTLYLEKKQYYMSRITIKHQTEYGGCMQACKVSFYKILN